MGIPLGTARVPFFLGADAAPGVLRGLRRGLGIEALPMPWAELGGAAAEKPTCLGRLGDALGMETTARLARFGWGKNN